MHDKAIDDVGRLPSGEQRGPGRLERSKPTLLPFLEGSATEVLEPSFIQEQLGDDLAAIKSVLVNGAVGLVLWTTMISVVRAIYLTINML
jgi:hypothetical protein